MWEKFIADYDRSQAPQIQRALIKWPRVVTSKPAIFHRQSVQMWHRHRPLLHPAKTLRSGRLPATQAASFKTSIKENGNGNDSI